MRDTPTLGLPARISSVAMCVRGLRLTGTVQRLTTEDPWPLSGIWSTMSRPPWPSTVRSVKDIDATVARLEGLGITFRSRPIQGPGGQQALVEDPSGHPVEIFQPQA